MKQVKLTFDSSDAYKRFFNAMMGMTNGKGITMDNHCEEEPLKTAGLDPEEQALAVIKDQPCDCETKITGVTNMYLLFVRRNCPVHGKLWKVC